MDDGLFSLRTQLAKAEENLRLIQERKAEYVLETDVPLQLGENVRTINRKGTNTAVGLGEFRRRCSKLLQEIL